MLLLLLEFLSAMDVILDGLVYPFHQGLPLRGGGVVSEVCPDLIHGLTFCFV